MIKNRIIVYIVFNFALLSFSLVGKAEELVSEVYFYSGVAVKVGYPFFLTGCGFQDGDQLIVEDVAQKNSFHLDLKIVDEETAKFRYPDGFQTGVYKLTLFRKGKTQDLGICNYVVVDNMPRGSEVIAHRGYWMKQGASQNSRTSLQNAIDLGVYGSETDVWLTRDGYLVCNHDASYNGVRIADATYEQVKKLVLSNNETMPTLEEFLSMLGKGISTKLIIEIKSHSGKDRNQAAADSTLSLVRKMELEDMVEYISFDMDVCMRLAEKAPYARISYLTGGISPQILLQDGITGLDYTAENYLNNPQWIDEAHELGMLTNVWTIDNERDIIEMNNLGIDFITTNYPERAMEIQKYYQKVIEEFEESPSSIIFKESVNENPFQVYSITGAMYEKPINGRINIIRGRDGKYRKYYLK